MFYGWYINCDYMAKDRNTDNFPDMSFLGKQLKTNGANRHVRI
jgi:hypothetical protein